jgi:hypothetical protein
MGRDRRNSQLGGEIRKSIHPSLCVAVVDDIAIFHIAKLGVNPAERFRCGRKKTRERWTQKSYPSNFRLYKGEDTITQDRKEDRWCDHALSGHHSLECITAIST